MGSFSGTEFQSNFGEAENNPSVSHVGKDNLLVKKFTRTYAEYEAETKNYFSSE